MPFASVLSLLLLAALNPSAGGTSIAVRLGLEAADPSEAALRQALLQRRSLDAFRGVSARFPATAASGLAQIAAGYSALEAARPGDATPFFRHADVGLTAIADVAAFGEAQALASAGDQRGAADAYTRAADRAVDGPLYCEALLRAAEARRGLADAPAAVVLLRRAESCPERAAVLSRLAAAQEAAGDAPGAAATYDHLDDEYPASDEARLASARLAALAIHLPKRSPEERAQRALKKALAVFDAREYSLAASLLRALSPTPDDRQLVAVRLGRALLATGRPRDGEAQLRSIPSTSPHAAEAAYALARHGRGPNRPTLRDVADRFPGTTWAEQALASLADSAAKEGRLDEALPYYRRIVDGHPEGASVDRALWRVAWAEYTSGRYETAATLLEGGARRRQGTTIAGFLYWAGRSRAALGQNERAKALFEETIRRFKRHYYGAKASETLASMPSRPAQVPVLRAANSEARLDLADSLLTRTRELCLIDRYDQAVADIQRLPPTPSSKAAVAWIENKRGRLRPAIIAMKGAYPEYLGEGGDLLSDDIWRIIYPIGYKDALSAKAGRREIDPAIVAALICQESTFDPTAVSRAGARGLMQIMPATGRGIARSLGRAFRTLLLHEPDSSLDFGVLYFSQMLDRFSGRIERALAAYNAGPRRVDQWTAAKPDMSAEDFVETIPLQETRYYVMNILAAQTHYRRLYFQDAPATTTTTTSQP